MKKRNIAGLALAGGVAVIVGVSVADGGDNAPGHTTVTESTLKPPSGSTGPATSFRNGTFKVGVDIKAGTYKTLGSSSAAGGGYCYWQRARDASGELESIIANDFSAGPNRATTKAGEVFHTTGDCDWKLVK